MENEMPNSKLDRISPSMVADYMSCPLCFYYRYIAKIRLPQKQIHLLFGSAIHLGIEHIYDNSDPYEPFIKAFDINRLNDDEKEMHVEYLGLGQEMLKNYQSEHPLLNELFNLHGGESEKYFRRKLINPMTGEESSLPYAGKIDRLTTNIIEYKTAGKKWNPDDVPFKVQTLIYNLWFYSEFGYLPDETVYIILLKKYKKVELKTKTKINQTIQVLTNHCTLNDLASIFDEVELILDKINKGQFERPRGGWHPVWCDCYKFEEILALK